MTTDTDPRLTIRLSDGSEAVPLLGEPIRHLEEFYSNAVSSVHVERLAAGAFWMQVDLDDGRSLMFQFSARSPIRAMVERDR